MKKALLSLAVVGLMAASANASTVSMRWQGTSGNKVSLAPSGSAVIEVVLELPAGETNSGVFFQFEPQPAGLHVSDTALLPDWIAPNGGTGLLLGALGEQFDVSALAAGVLSGPGTFVIAETLIHLEPTGDAIGTEYEVAADLNANVGVVNGAGTLTTFFPNFANTPGFWTFGQGSGGRDGGALGVSARDPLIITLVPEPGTIALLAIGGFGVVMRRRRS